MSAIGWRTVGIGSDRVGWCAFIVVEGFSAFELVVSDIQRSTDRMLR